MAVSVVGDAQLSWTASIDTNTLVKKQIAEIKKLVNSVAPDTKKVVADIANGTRQQLNVIREETKKTNKAISDLTTEAVASSKKRQAEEIQTAKITQQRITKIVKDETIERQTLAARETEKLMKQYPSFGTGNRNNKQYQFGAPVVKNAVDPAFLESIKTSTKVMGDLDATTKDYVSELVELQVQQAKIKSLQKELNTVYKNGSITEREYLQATEQLTGAQLKVGESIGLINERQKEFEALRDVEKGSIIDQKKRVDELKIAYLSLSKAQQESVSGKKMLAEITTLNTSIAAANKQVNTVAETSKKASNGIANVASKAFGALKTFAYLIPGLGIAGLIGFIVEAITEGIKRIIEGSQDAISRTKLLADSAKKIGERYAETSSKIRPYIDVLKNSNLTEQERLNIYNKLVQIDPQIVKGIDAKTLSYDKLNNNVTAYLDNLRRLARFDVYEESLKESIKQEQVLEDRINTSEKILKNLKDIYKEVGVSDITTASTTQFGTTNALNIGDQVQAEENNLERLRKALKEQEETTAKIGVQAVKQNGLITTTKERTLKVIDEEIAAQQELRKLESTSAGVQAIDKKIEALEKEKAAIEGKSKKQIAEEKKYSDALHARADFLEKINQLERDANQTGMTQKQKDIDAINQKYDEQIKAIDTINKKLIDFNNANPKNKVGLFGSAEEERINSARQTELLNLQYREDAQNFITSIEEKRTAFEGLENSILQGNTIQTAAFRELYKDQVKDFDSYASYLKDEYAKLALDVLAGTADNGQLLKFEALTKLLDQAFKDRNDKLKTAELDLINDTLNAAKSFDAKRIDIEKKYTKQFEIFAKKRGTISEAEYKKGEKQLQNNRQDEINALADEFLQNTQAFKDLQKGTDDLTRNSIKKLIGGFKEARAEIVKMGGDVTVIDKIIKGLNIDLTESSTNSLREVANLISSAGEGLNVQLTKTLKLTSQQIGAIVNNIATLFDGNASKSQKTTSLVGIIVSLVGSISNVVTSALQNQKDLASGLEPSVAAAEAVTLAIQAQNKELERQREIVDGLYGQDRIDGLLNLQDSLQKKIRDTFQALKDLSLDAIVSQGEYYVDSLFHGRDDAFRSDTTAGKIFGILNDPLGLIPKTVRVKLETIDTTGIQDIDGFIRLLDEIKRNGGKLNGKEIVEDDIKALEELVTNYENLVDQQRELREELMQVFTGTTRDQIADSIIEGLRAGKRGIEDFAGTFEDLMKNAIINSLKYQTLEPLINQFYEQFAQLSASGGTLTSEEIENLRDLYTDILTRADAQLQNLQDVTGLTLGQTDETNSLKGAIKGMTESQAELLAGQFGGLRMTAAEQLEVAQASINVLNQIQANTAPIRLMYDLWLRVEREGFKIKP